MTKRAGEVTRADLLDVLAATPESLHAELLEQFGYQYSGELLARLSDESNLDKALSLNLATTGREDLIASDEVQSKVGYWVINKIEPVSVAEIGDKNSCTEDKLTYAKQGECNVPRPAFQYLFTSAQLARQSERLLASDVASKSIDVPKAVLNLSRNLPASDLPRQRRRYRNRQLLILLDRSPHLMPLWADYNAMLCAIADRRGRDLCMPVYLREGPSSNFWDPIARRELTLADLPVGSDTLVISDMGRYSATANAAAWRGLWAHLEQHGCMLRTLRLPEHEINEAAVGYLSAAMARMHLPCLQRLRALRIALAQAGVTTGVQDELAVWNHPHRMALSPRSWVLQEAKRKYWLQQFLRIPPALRNVLQSTMQNWRKHLAPEASGLEQLLGYQLDMEAPPSPECFDGALSKCRAQGAPAGPAEAWLYAANNLLRNTPRGGRAVGYKRLFSAAQRVAESYDQPLPLGLALLNKDELREPLRLVEKMGELVVVGADESYECSVLDKKGPYLDVETGRILRAGGQLQGTELEIDGQRLSFEKKYKPSWALGIGRDSYGVYVVTQNGRAYWWREEPASEKAINRPHGRFAPKKSGWWSETQCPIRTLNTPVLVPKWAKGRLVTDKYGLLANCEIEGLNIRFRWIPPGEFLMGSPATEKGRYDNETQYKVVLTLGYWLAETTCTQALWQAVMGETPSSFKGSEHPVESVSWQDIKERFLPALNKRIAGANFCLPIEAQWEYACRAGGESAFHWGDELSYKQARYAEVWDYDHENLSESIGKAHEALKENNRYGTTEVDAFEPNAWGLYQMHGNVFEWCEDGYGDYPSEVVCNPEGAPEASRRVLRGGSWFFPALYARSARRRGVDPADRVSNIGFRLAQVPSEH